MCKLEIESSVEMGSTLSSDLLCLTAFKCNDSLNSYLVAGGVDGRLHRWTLPNPDGLKKSSDITKAGVVAAHNGRLNNVMICSKFGTVVTVGADGAVICRCISLSKSFEDWPTSCITMREELTEPEIKLTSLCIVQETHSELIVCVGSSCGKVFWVKVVRTDDENVQMTLLKSCSINDNESETRCIHAMCSFSFNTSLISKMSVIGHSSGLCYVNAST